MSYVNFLMQMKMANTFQEKEVDEFDEIDRLVKEANLTEKERN